MKASYNLNQHHPLPFAIYAKVHTEIPEIVFKKVQVEPIDCHRNVRLLQHTRMTFQSNYFLFV